MIVVKLKIFGPFLLYFLVVYSFRHFSALFIHETYHLCNPACMDVIAQSQRCTVIYAYLFPYHVIPRNPAFSSLRKKLIYICVNLIA